MDPELQNLYDQGVVSDEFLRTLNVGGGGAGSAGGGWYAGGGGGGGGFARVFATDNTNRLVPDLDQIIGTPLRVQLRDGNIHTINRIPSEEERQEMAWSDTDAQEIARDILREQKKEGLREKVTAAVAGYREMLAGANCGSVFSFMKVNEKGDHYWYAAIKNGGKWYTTAQSPRVLEDDDAFIEWLVLLQAYESEATELTQGAAHKALELGPIDTTAS